MIISSCGRYRNREENLEVLEQSLNAYIFDFTRYLDFIQYVNLCSDFDSLNSIFLLYAFVTSKDLFKVCDIICKLLILFLSLIYFYSWSILYFRSRFQIADIFTLQDKNAKIMLMHSCFAM